MSFESFEVYLHTLPESSLRSGNTRAELNAVVCDIQARWPDVRSDEVEIARLYHPLSPDARLLVYETPEGLVQFYLGLDTETGSIVITLSTAHCNPPSVQPLYCDMVMWLMQRYRLRCLIACDLAPEQSPCSDSTDIAQGVCSLLIPALEYNRRLWQADAHSNEDATLRPGDAMARYMTPLFLNESK